MLKYWILCTELFLHAHVFSKVLLKMSDKSAKNPLKMFSRSNLGFVFQKYLAIMGCLHGLNRSHVAWNRFKKTFTSSVFLRHAKGGTPFRFISFIKSKAKHNATCTKGPNLDLNLNEKLEILEPLLSMALNRDIDLRKIQ